MSTRHRHEAQTRTLNPGSQPHLYPKLSLHLLAVFETIARAGDDKAAEAVRGCFRFLTGRVPLTKPSGSRFRAASKGL